MPRRPAPPPPPDEDDWASLLSLMGDRPRTYQPEPVKPKAPVTDHKPFTHYCHCGKWGSFGFGVNVRRDIAGDWFCREHRP